MSAERACRASPAEAWQALLSGHDELARNAAEKQRRLEKKHLSISAPDSVLALGTQFRGAWRRFTIMRAEVMAFEPNHRVELSWRMPMLRGTVTCEVEPNGSGSLLRARLSLSSFWVGRLWTQPQLGQSSTEPEDDLKEWAELAERIHDGRLAS